MNSFDYHVALSFSGKDRPYVEEIAHLLMEKGVKVFYDLLEEADLWGKDLYTYLSDIYRKRANYTIIFISQNYADGLWTNHERKNAQSRAFSENSEYILPARFDDTEIPGIIPTIGYVDLRKKSKDDFVVLIMNKLMKAGIILEPPDSVLAFEELNDSTIFFSNRFSSSFPGVRGFQIFENPKKSIQRLSKLLAHPLEFNYKEDNSVLINATYRPIWWWRGGNLPIRSFKVINEETGNILIDNYELQVSKVIAVNPGDYYRCFVYLESSPMKPMITFPEIDQYIAESIEKKEIMKQEYGLYRSQFPVTRQEYDDGAADIDGMLTNILGKTELRLRPLTAYNLIIAGQETPINNTHFDLELRELMNKILYGEIKFEELCSIIERLPRNRRYRRTLNAAQK